VDCDGGVFMVNLFLSCVEQAGALYIGHEDECMDRRQDDDMLYTPMEGSIFFFHDLYNTRIGDGLVENSKPCIGSMHYC